MDFGALGDLRGQLALQCARDVAAELAHQGRDFGAMAHVEVPFCFWWRPAIKLTGGRKVASRGTAYGKIPDCSTAGLSSSGGQLQGTLAAARKRNDGKSVDIRELSTMGKCFIVTAARRRCGARA